MFYSRSTFTTTQTEVKCNYYKQSFVHNAHDYMYEWNCDDIKDEKKLNTKKYFVTNNLF